MMRFIPRKTKVKITVFRNFTILDAIFILFGLALTVVIATMNLFNDTWTNIYVAVFFAGAYAMLFLELGDNLRLYHAIGLSFKFMAYNKL